MIINDPGILREVWAAFEAYEAALRRNDSSALDAFFLHRDDTVRYGAAEMQYGIEEIRAFRAKQRPFERQLSRTVIVTYGDNAATASTLFYRIDLPGLVGRQQQTWLRIDVGWRIVAAHVSMMQATET
jgi:ketosteroid isomerase-like protein